MNPETTLLRALRADPTDESAWLALADSLEEQGRLEQADLLRRQRALRRMPEGEQRRAKEETIRQMLASGVDPVVPAIVNSIGMRLVLIPPGGFWMGTPEDVEPRLDSEGPRHWVEITRPFYLGAYQVTQQQFERVLGRNLSHFVSRGRNRVPGQRFDWQRWPVDRVNWEDCQAFCQRLSELPAERIARRVYRLPTEAEWEYACRAGALHYTHFHVGDVLYTTQANYDGNHPASNGSVGVYLRRPAPVGSYRPNAFGLYDMHGNLWEWCFDRFDPTYYAISPDRDPTGPPVGSNRVLRGGSWDCIGNYCRTSHRLDQAPDTQNNGFGFRVVCDWPASGGT